MFRAIFNFLFGTKYDGIINLQEDAIEIKQKFIRPFTTSEFGLELIRKHEGLRLTAYKDTGGVWTIGYGYTLGVTPGMMITYEKAEELLKVYLKQQDESLSKLLSNIELNSQKQYDVISSFVYNVGIKQFSTSTFLKKIAEKNWLAAADQLIRIDPTGKYRGWIYDNGKAIKGLINRRLDEKKLFLEGSI